MATQQIEVVLLNGAVPLERGDWDNAPAHLREFGEYAELVIKTRAAWMILRQGRSANSVPHQRSPSARQRSRREVHSRPARANAPPSDDVPLPGRPPVQYRRSVLLVVCALEKFEHCGPQSRGKIVGLLSQAGISEPSIKRHLRRLVAEGVIVEVTVPGDRRKFYRLAGCQAVAA